MSTGPRDSLLPVHMYDSTQALIPLQYVVGLYMGAGYQIYQITILISPTKMTVTSRTGRIKTTSRQRNSSPRFSWHATNRVGRTKHRPVRVSHSMPQALRISRIRGTCPYPDRRTRQPELYWSWRAPVDLRPDYARVRCQKLVMVAGTDTSPS